MNKVVVKAMKDPRWLIGVSWPMVLAIPYLPGIPKPSLGGLAWRQELMFATLLVATLAILLRRQRETGLAAFFSGLPSSSLLITGTLFVGWVAASVLWAANPYSAAHYAFTWGAYILFFVLMHQVAACPRAMRASFYGLGVLVWLLCLSCLIEWLGGAALTDYALRANVKPLFRGFSGFGETIAVAAPIFGALSLSIKKTRTAIVCGATALIAWLGILLGLQRAPILGAAAGFLLLGLGVLAFKRCRPQNFQRIALLFASLVIVSVVPFVGPAAISQENLSVSQRLSETSLSQGNVRARLFYWGVALEMFREHPLLGVGANNYEVAFTRAREQFSATHPGNALVGMNEHLLAQYAHNEYLQILAELGIVGILLFATLCFLLARAFWRALQFSPRPLLPLGAAGGLLAFALSSGASAFSFRWFGSGLVCCFAAALVTYLAKPVKERQQAQRGFLQLGFVQRRLAPASAFAFAALLFVGAGMQGMNSLTHAWAQTSESPEKAEKFYRRAVGFNPFDAATHFDYGSLLYHQRRYQEAVSHLQYAVDHGLNTSINFAALAAAQEQAGDLNASERTLAAAARAYPLSVFILVRHAAALARQGRNTESEHQLAKALMINERAARGWYQVINFDIDAALVAAQKDPTLAPPGELGPLNAMFVVLKENERRLNIPANRGWRGRVGSLAN